MNSLCEMILLLCLAFGVPFLISLIVEFDVTLVDAAFIILLYIAHRVHKLHLYSKQAIMIQQQHVGYTQELVHILKEKDQI